MTSAPAIPGHPLLLTEAPQTLPHLLLPLPITKAALATLHPPPPWQRLTWAPATLTPLPLLLLPTGAPLTQLPLLHPLTTPPPVTRTLG